MAISEDSYAGQAEPARVDVAGERADLRGQHGRRVLRARSRATRPTSRRTATPTRRSCRRCRTSWSQKLATVPPRRSARWSRCEGAFSYLARDAGLTREVHLGRQRRAAGHARSRSPRPSSSSRPTTSRPSSASRRCRTRRCGRWSRPRAPTFGGTLYVDSLSEADGPVPTYLDLIRHDANTIITDGLTGAAS